MAGYYGVLFERGVVDHQEVSGVMFCDNQERRGDVEQ